MQIFSSNTYKERRASLRTKVDSGIIFITGNTESPMNYRDNIYRFRQDSNFRYFFGIDLPNLHAMIDCDTGEEIIFGNEYTMEDIIWIGPHEALSSMAEKVGVSKVEGLSSIPNYINSTKKVHYTTPYRHDNMIYLASLLGLNIAALEHNVSEKLIKSIVDIRSYKTEEEIEQMDNAVNITRAMHLSAMRHTRPGKFEYEVVAQIRRKHLLHHAELAYPVIFSVNGQTLHNHHHGNKMSAGQLVLNDSGAENLYGYAGDITRTFPVNGKFSQKQKEIYSLVLKMEKDSISALKPGIKYKDIHVSSNKIMLEGMKDLGIVSGDVEEMVQAGVGGLFMPHGLGHMIGMDVHDMEDLGEKYVGYREGLERSTQLGLKSLRLARELEEGFVLTVEPGIYFIPELIDKMKAENKFASFVNYEKLEDYKDFGGIRIEDDILITAEGHKVLGNYIPKEIDEINLIMNS
ncbi:aminopeptidase P family protein [Saprospiraceae bacterium]|nr:aminopeptidase P family protein [Saprospiraceae bacterium]